MVKGTVVYDGDCGICTWSAQWIVRHVSCVKVASHTDFGLESIDAVLFVTGDSRYEGAVAVSEVLSHADQRRWRALGAVMSWPLIRTCARAVYVVVARNRARISRLFGMTACALPGSRG